jgi:hypothetical protein
VRCEGSRGPSTDPRQVVGLYWAVIIGLVLMIPILAIVLDSSVGQAWANRIARDDEDGKSPEIDSRVHELEAEVKYLTESMESLREETEFVRRLIEGTGEGDTSRLGPGE